MTEHKSSRARRKKPSGNRPQGGNVPQRGRTQGARPQRGRQERRDRTSPSRQHHKRSPLQPPRNKPGIRHIDVTGEKHLRAPAGTPRLKVYALGGLEEIGRNCTIFECGDDIVIIDMGLMFPEEGMPGIDYIIPDISSLKGKEKNIRALIVTHGHMDHVGGIPLTARKLGYPTIYTAPLTAGIIKKRQEEFGDEKSLKFHLIKDQTRIQMGRHFAFEPFHVNHNISDAFGVALHTPYGTIIYTGDFKFDYTPVEDEPANLSHIASFGLKGVLAMFADSTNAESPGHQLSESVVGAELEKIIRDAPGRLIIGTFSSLLTRVQQIMTIAEKYGKKVLIEGRSMTNNVELAHTLGYMHYKPGLIIEKNSLKGLPDNKLIVICTGAQGEKNAALMRIANDGHRFIKLRKGDGVIFSSSVIPGNERTVQSLKDTLVRQGATVYHYNNLDVHAGGHARQEDLKLMARLVKPKYHIPIHGNRFLLEAHGRLAKEVGIPEENVLIADNGQLMEFDNNGARLLKDRVSTEYIMVDGLGVGDASNIVVRDRIMLAEDGIFLVIATLEKRTGKLVGSPDIISRGFIHMKENKGLIEQVRAKVKTILKDTDSRSPAFEDHLKNKLRNEVGSFLFKTTKKRPMVLPVIIEV